MTRLCDGNRVRAILAILGTVAACSGAPAGSTIGDGGRGAGSGTGATVDAGDDLPKATDFADVSVEQDFSEPVWLPPPSTTIEGDATSLVGSWVQVGSDGSQCPPSLQWCWHMEIRNDTGGTVSGTIHVEGPSNGPVSGPFAPAVDPNVGYPTTVTPDNYGYVRQSVLPNVPYQLFDGVVSNGSFVFWFSTLDLWSGWCALQNPSPWTVDSQRKYRCVPQTADRTTTDLGKLALCTSAEDGPICNGQPCVCEHDAGGSFPLCGNTVCECSATECRADVRSEEINATLQLNAGRLVGPFDSGFESGGYMTGGAPSIITFQRVSP
jgi:hypothetical protein